MDAKANYPENGKPTWQCGSKLRSSEELGGELSGINDHNSNVMSDAKYKFKATMALAMGSSGGYHGSHSHCMNGKERARSAAHTSLNKKLLKTHYCHVYKSQAKKSRCSHRSQAAYIYLTVVDDSKKRYMEEEAEKGKQKKTCVFQKN